MLQRVDFYILNSHQDQDRWRILGTLLGRQWLKGHRFHIHCRDQNECEELDSFLWQSDITDFLPHHRLDKEFAGDSPITLGHPQSWPEKRDILVNFDLHLPEAMHSFERVLEIVVQDPVWLDAQRDHYRQFKKMGLTPQIHKLG
ncbi:DNA polymerase III subunit chi [Pokkaliibacter sp. MBI-7]|uniref:DNA polymerase III subunit chi n=1 Tax=Pokkaliibacter sp. MBI-7 TaxID=3040600 RepID=UPI002449F6D7|nr:DNA polymerase III subunit chi [Pokkaliibacter sp. MBI-7]MDH2431981.1 DNA polymerase III subunit chi [Pokkaliibacter sp. MBI-7]